MFENTKRFSKLKLSFKDIYRRKAFSEVTLFTVWDSLLVISRVSFHCLGQGKRQYYQGLV